MRPIIDSNFEHYYKWHSDMEIRFQTAMHPFPVSERNERSWFEAVTNDTSNKRVVFTIIDNKSKTPIGYFQLMEINFINRNAMLGIVIGNKDFQGKGNGQEIMELGLQYSFEYLGLNKISLEVVSENARAIKLYKKLGFVEEGLFFKHYFYNGKFNDVMRLTLFNG